MKKIAFLVATAFVMLSCTEKNKSMQIEDGSLVTLSNYAIPLNQKGATIATVNGVEGITALSKDTANIFEVNTMGKIALKPDFELNANSPMSYEIELRFGEKTKAFVLVKDEFIRNGVVAHRGAWKHHNVSQNSIGSLKSAIAIGCEGVEFDVWISSDDQIILSHDPQIGGKMVEETTANELIKIELANNEFLPTLTQYLELIKTQNKSRLVLEIKVSQKGEERNKQLSEACVKAVHDAKAQAWVDYISFGFENLKKVRELDKSAHIAYLETDKGLETLKEAGISGIDYHFSSFQNDSDLVDYCNQLNLSTNFWTVNDSTVMKDLLASKVRFMTTDEPETLLELIK